jgi:hypothetical protein
MPGLDVGATYQKSCFGKDIVAGIVLAVPAWTMAPFVVRNDLIAIDSVGDHRPAGPGNVKRLGSDPTIAVLKAGTPTGEIAAHSEDLHRLSGPFRRAEARRE